MKKGFEIVNLNICEGNNAILVANYPGLNAVKNYQINQSEYFSWKDNNDIGMWKIKSVN